MRQPGNFQTLLFVAICLFFAHIAQGQTTVQANKVIAKDSIKIGSRWVYLVDTDTTFASANNRSIPTSLAVKTFVENLSFSPILAGDSGAGTNDTIKVLGGYGASTSFTGGYVYVVADTLENPTLKTGNFTIAQNRNITIAANKSLKFAGSTTAFTSASFTQWFGSIGGGKWGFRNQYLSSGGSITVTGSQDTNGTSWEASTSASGGKVSNLSLLAWDERFDITSITAGSKSVAVASRKNLGASANLYGLFLYGSDVIENRVGASGYWNWNLNGSSDKMRLTNSGNLGIGTITPARLLHVEGEVRITDLTTDTPTQIVGADADGDLGRIVIGSGLVMSGDTLSATGGGGAVSDGDKGDITVSGSGATWTIDAGAIALADLAFTPVSANAVGASGQILYSVGSNNANSESAFVWNESSNKLSIGNTSTIWDVTIDKDATDTGLGVVAHSATATQRPVMAFARTRGTLSSPASVVSGDLIGSFTANGYDGSGYQTTGRIDFRVDGTVSAGVVPLAYDFVTGTTEANRAARLTITSSGSVGVGLTTGMGARFTVKGAGTSSSSYGLLIENSSGTDILSVRDDGAIVAGGSNFAGRLTVTGFGSTTGIAFTAENSSGTDIIQAKDDVTVGIGTGAAANSFLSVAASTALKSSLNIAEGTAPTSPVDGDIYHESNTLSAVTGSLVQAISGTIFRGSNTSTLTNSTTETSITPSGSGTLTLPANFLVAGKTIRVKFSGNYSTDAVAAPDLNIKVKFGTTVVAEFTNSELTITSSGQISGEFNIQTYTTGASGTVYGSGVAWLNYGTSGGKQVWNSQSTTTVTVNTTTSQAISLVGQWSVADTDNSITIRMITVEVL